MANQYVGLSWQEVKKRREQFGPNALPVPKHRFLKLVFRQFSGIFNILLIIASIVTFLLGEPIDGVFILFFILLGVTLNIIQEYKSNAAADKLKSYLVRTATVRREGKDQEIPTSEIVPGDLLKLEAGDIVPADAVIRQARNLLADETTFTGESISIAKQETAKSNEKADDIHRLLQGVVIVNGNALAEVTATGTSTRLARIASTATSMQGQSDLVKGIDRISKFILYSTLITLLFVVLANLLIEGKNTDIPHLLIFSIALAVSVIPEALPLVLTFSLSRGALAFAKKDVIVKRLSSVQDLGSVNLLCTDKTGTITENRLTFQAEFLAANSDHSPLLLARLAAYSLGKGNPEPFDIAVDEAISAQQRREISAFQLLEEEAFDPTMRSNGAILRSESGKELHIRRGSPEYFKSQGLFQQEQAQGWLEEEEQHGHRVLGVSYDDGGGARFAGFVSFADRLKATTIETIEEAKRLNIAITIITGDALMVAEAIGREAGLVTQKDQVIDATAFLSLSTPEQIQRVGSIRVFARTTPEQKLEIILLLKQQYTVGFLGEGINDAPALKASSVSLVVQSAADVARETADIILLKNDLRVIVDGIRLGRETHANTFKYIRATLVSNFGNFYAVAIGSLFIDFLPMLPKQLLLLNLLSDFPMMAIAFDRVTVAEIDRPQKYDFRSLYIIFITLGLLSTVFDFLYFGLFYKISPAVLQTNWFIASVLTELLLLVSIRSMLPIEKAGWPAPLITILSAGAILITIALPLIPWTAKFFEFSSPSIQHLGIIFGLAVLYLILSELLKRPLSKFLSRQEMVEKPLKVQD